MIETARAYLRAGLCPLPAILAEKRPALSAWKQYQKHLPTEHQLQHWFTDSQPICLLTGAISGNLELIDFDFGGELFEPWRELVEAESPGLAERLIIERSQSGGHHVIFRCEATIPGNQKLAQRIIQAPDQQDMVIDGKRYRPHRVGDQYAVTVTLIETRGEGGLFLCHPTPGYTLEQGDLQNVPVLTEDKRNILIEAALALNEAIPSMQTSHGAMEVCGRPGDDYNERGDIRALLTRHGWTCVRCGENECWRRPGKDCGWSATLRDRVFYVFSSNAAPFEPNHPYAPFAVYALLEHQGILHWRLKSYGTRDTVANMRTAMWTCRTSSSIARHIRHCHLLPNIQTQAPPPTELFRVPGFVSEVMDHCLATAPYPNVPLAFCGALALQAVLAGRKVRDQADNRSNLYLLALGYSSVGKDWPRKVNTFVLHQAGLVESLGEKFASGEGIQDSLFRTPAMLFQTDEIDGLLQSINKAHDARHENILGTLLTMYSASNSIFPMRRKAGKESPGVIDQPCLVVYGTAIPTHYYGALSERMLTNGFFARMLIVESGSRSTGQEPGIIDPPPRVMETARWWADFSPGTGNLERFHPQPRIIEADNDARPLLTEARQAAEAEYAAAETRGDPVGTTVWGRVPEQIRKLALLYAVSVSHESSRIDVGAVRWATDFILHQTRRMLFMAHNHVAENPFHAECLKLIRKLREAPDRRLAHSVLLKRMKIDAKTFQELITTLEQQGDVTTVTQSTAGRPQRVYQLAGAEQAGEGTG